MGNVGDAPACCYRLAALLPPQLPAQPTSPYTYHVSHTFCPCGTPPHCLCLGPHTTPVPTGYASGFGTHTVALPIAVAITVPQLDLDTHRTGPTDSICDPHRRVSPYPYLTTPHSPCYLLTPHYPDQLLNITSQLLLPCYYRPIC